jgi:hypothetical protein
MDKSTHRARITEPLPYAAGAGSMRQIPVGPCLVQSIGANTIDVTWGALAQSSVVVPIDDIVAAWDRGHLILLD